MAAETEEGSSEAPPQETAKKGKLAEEWRKLAGWQKAGVIIAGVGVVAAIVYYVNHQSSPTATGNSATQPSDLSYGLPGGSLTGYPGEGDYYPSVPVTPTSGTSGTTTGTSGTTTTTTGTGTTTKPPTSGPIPSPLRPQPVLSQPVRVPFHPAAAAPNNKALTSKAASAVAAFKANPFQSSSPFGGVFGRGSSQSSGNRRVLL